MQHNELLASSPKVEQLIYGLWRLLIKNAPELQEITPEYVMQLGQELIDAVFQATPADEAMKHYTAKERLAGLDPKERLIDLDPKEFLSGLDLKDGLAGLTPDQIRHYLEQLEKSNPQ